MLLRKFDLLFERLEHHPFVVIWDAEFSALSGLYWLVVGLLTYGEVAITSPVSIVVIVAINLVGTRANLRLGEHELVVTGLVLQRLARKGILICHYLMRDVHGWGSRPFWRPPVIWAPLWLNSWLKALWSSPWGAIPTHRLWGHILGLNFILLNVNCLSLLGRDTCL